MSSPSWDRLSRFYDWQLGLERSALQAALEVAAPRSEDRLLDLGTGTAALLRELARMPARPRQAVGIDASPKMLDRAPKLPAGWRLQLGDARSLPFDDASFDLVTAAFLLHLLDRESVRSLLLETRRVLAGGGRLVTVTPLASSTLRGRAYAAGVGAAARLAPWLFSGLRSYNPQPALASSGFRVVATRTVTNGYRSLCIRAEPCNRGVLPASVPAVLRRPTHGLGIGEPINYEPRSEVVAVWPNCARSPRAGVSQVGLQALVEQLTRLFPRFRASSMLGRLGHFDFATAGAIYPPAPNRGRASARLGNRRCR